MLFKWKYYFQMICSQFINLAYTTPQIGMVNWPELKTRAFGLCKKIVIGRQNQLSCLSNDNPAVQTKSPCLQSKPVYHAAFSPSQCVLCKMLFIHTSCLFQMDNVASQKVKKKRVLPQWMLEPEKTKNSFKQTEKPKDERPVVHVMSPYELEQGA